jgi:hypothetical protein
MLKLETNWEFVSEEVVPVIRPVCSPLKVDQGFI